MEEMVRDVSDARHAFISVYVCKIIHDTGRLKEFMQDGPEYVDSDTDYAAVRIGLYYVTEKVWSSVTHDSDYGEVIETLYFSDSTIMEYYRLCREYGKRHGVKLATNPYMLEAKRFVDNCLDQGCPVCEYRLQTKINHDWASGVVFRMWPEFEWHFALLTLIHQIFGFYREQLQRLKKELELDQKVTEAS
jgi:phenylalanine-4-hydroxylase